MSKQAKRKITVDVGGKAAEVGRPSVFERLGTKKAASKKAGEREHCRQWAAHGVCAYGKGCKFAATHTLVSPSKARAGMAGKEDAAASRLHSAVVRADELDAWDQSDLEYADTDVLEKRRQQLQRELELQLKMESGAGKEPRKAKKKQPSSSSSSRSSSSSSASSSSGGSSSSTSSSRDGRKKNKKGKPKRNSSSSSNGEAPTKKKRMPKDAPTRGKSAPVKKAPVKKDERLIKKHDTAAKKKVLVKVALGKKSLSPGKKSSATPPINKVPAKSYPARKHSRSPVRREKNRSVSPTLAKDKERERQRERDRDREKDRERRPKSRSPIRKGRSRSPLRKDPRKKESPERIRPISPKKVRRELSTDKHRKSPTRDRDRRDHKDRSLERRKDDKERHEREKLLTRQRERDRPKEAKRDTSKRARERREDDRGLQKPNKPMERLLPRPEERMAALAAICNKNQEPDKSSTNSKDRQDSHSERGRQLDRSRDRGDRSKRDRMSLDRDHSEYERALDRSYDRGHSIERGYERVGDRYDEVPREVDNRSPGYGRERHYDPGYDIPRSYPEPEDRGYADHIGDHRAVDMGFDERRGRREHSWEGSEGRLERERAYLPPHHKEWEGEEFRGGEWSRERHWQHREPQMGEWPEKEPELEPAWHRAPPAPHAPHPPHPPPHARPPRMHGAEEGYGRGARAEPAGGKRRAAGRGEPDAGGSAAAVAVKLEPAGAPLAADDAPPDDLSEISDDPDDILNQDDMLEREEDERIKEERPPSAERVEVKLEAADDAPHNHHLQDGTMSSPPTVKTEPQDSKDEEEMKELDFEEISDGELEEERTRAGLGDALGVDWASLVAEVRRSKEPAAAAGARQRWLPAAALARVGLSRDMAGDKMFAEVFSASGDEPGETPAHPVASIQVAMARRRQVRAALFGSGCDVTRALSARRDLALRRHLCGLPAPAPATAPAPAQPALFHAARALLMQSG